MSARASNVTVRAAILAGDVEQLRMLRAEGARLLLDDDPLELDGLMLAAAAGHRAVVELLLEAGADPRQKRNNEFTALHAAAMEGHSRIVALLLDAGADPNAQTSPQKYAPLHSAAFAGHDETIRLLLAHGARLDLESYRGERPSDTARRTGMTTTAALLDAAATRPANAGEHEGRSPAVTEFSWGRIEVAGRVFKDARLFPGGAEEWDWNKTGTRHRPGVQFADIEDLVAETRPETVILARGIQLVLQVPQDTIEKISTRVSNVIVLESGEAVSEYNRRRVGEAVVALIHSTC